MRRVAVGCALGIRAFPYSLLRSLFQDGTSRRCAVAQICRSSQLRQDVPRRPLTSLSPLVPWRQQPDGWAMLPKYPEQGDVCPPMSSTCPLFLLIRRRIFLVPPNFSRPTLKNGISYSSANFGGPPSADTFPFPSTISSPFCPHRPRHPWLSLCPTGRSGLTLKRGWPTARRDDQAGSPRVHVGRFVRFCMFFCLRRSSLSSFLLWALILAVVGARDLRFF